MQAALDVDMDMNRPPAMGRGYSKCLGHFDLIYLYAEDGEALHGG